MIFLFVLFIVSFAVQKLVSFIRSHLFIFVFIPIPLGGGSQKILLWFMSKSVFPMFSSKSFIVSGLTFRSLLHVEFIFVSGVRECSSFILLHVAVQFSQPHLWKRLSFLQCMFLPPLPSPSLIIRRMHIKTTMRPSSENLQTINAGEGVEKREPSCTAGGNVN